MKFLSHTYLIETDILLDLSLGLASINNKHIGGQVGRSTKVLNIIILQFVGVLLSLLVRSIFM